MSGLVAVDAPHFYAGMILKNGVVIKAAPILHWAIGKTQAYLTNYFWRKKWKVTIVELDDEI